MNHRIYWGDARAMDDLSDQSVHLVVTSPPYWALKDYGCAEQIGFDQSLESYLESLSQVWRECHRVLHGGCRMAINVGDQFARAAHFGRYKVIPLHAQIIVDAEAAGFDFMGSIIWQKVTSQNASGGGAVMGSFPLPRNGIVKLDYEHILLFKKLGVAPKPNAQQKAAATMTTQQWNEYFAGHWQFPGEKQSGHLASFPLELPLRLIAMFSFPGETILDPFAGAATTIKAAMDLGRVGVGYEINRDFENAMRARLGLEQPDLFGTNVAWLDGCAAPVEHADAGQTSMAMNPKAAKFGSVVERGDLNNRAERGARLKGVVSPVCVALTNGETMRLRGVRASAGREQDGVAALEKLLKQRGVFAREVEDGAAYLYLDNKTFVNAKLIRLGLCEPDESEHRLAARFAKIYEEQKNG